MGVWVDESLGKNEVGIRSDNDQLKVAKEESISTKKYNVYNILLFFHFMGMLFYHHEVEETCEVVFIDLSVAIWKAN